MKSHDFTLALPVIGSTVTLEGRSLDNDQLNLKLRYDSEGEVEGKACVPTEKNLWILELPNSV